MVPPKCLMRTKIWHVNIDPLGRICLSILKPEYTPEEVEEKKAAGKEDDLKIQRWSPACPLDKVSS